MGLAAVRRSLPHRAGTIKTARTPPGAAEAAMAAQPLAPPTMMDEFRGGQIPAPEGAELRRGYSHEAQRRAWSRKEDDAIMRFVGKHGTKRWAIISQELNLPRSLVSDLASSVEQGGSTTSTRGLKENRGPSRRRTSSTRPSNAWATSGRRSRNCCRVARTTPSRTTGTPRCGGTCRSLAKDLNEPEEENAESGLGTVVSALGTSADLIQKCARQMGRLEAAARNGEVPSLKRRNDDRGPTHPDGRRAPKPPRAVFTPSISLHHITVGRHDARRAATGRLHGAEGAGGGAERET